MSKFNYPFACTYYNRYPDPGMCTVLTIDFENRKLTCFNGAVRLSPSFDEVQMFQSVGQSLSTGKQVFEKIEL